MGWTRAGLVVWVAGLGACAAGSGTGDVGALSFSQLDYGLPVQRALDDQIAYVDVGEGPETLVLVHGLASNLGFWRYNIPELAERYRVIAVDLPGYGRSAKSDDYPYTLSFFAETIRDLVAELGLGDVTLIGQSMGGQIAMLTAIQHPDVVDRLVLVDPAGIEAFTAEEGAALRSAYTVAGIRATPEDAIRRNLALNFHVWDDRLEWMVEERVGLARTDEFDQFAHAVVQSVGAMLDEPTAPRLDRIAQPTLIVYGQYDELIPNTYLHPGLPRDVFREGAERIPDATLVEIEDAGHLVMMERPVAFNSAVLAWLRHH